MSTHAAHHHVLPKAVYWRIFWALMVLLVLTVLASFVDLGRANNIAVALIIAIVKAALVILYFMHVKFASRLTWVFAGAAFLWLLILLGMTSVDYISRSWSDTQTLHGWDRPELTQPVAYAEQLAKAAGQHEQPAEKADAAPAHGN